MGSPTLDRIADLEREVEGLKRRLAQEIQRREVAEHLVEQLVGTVELLTRD
jgi:hypothetical protein